MDGETGRFECGPGVVALAADNVGYSNLFGSLGDRVGDGVASVQDCSFSCLLRDDLTLRDRIGERFGGRCDEAEPLDSLLCGVRAHPVEGWNGERLASLGEDDVDGRVVRHRGARRHGLGDDLSLWNVLGVGIRDGTEGQACIGERFLRIILGLAGHVGHVLHVDALGDVERNLSALMDRRTALRVRASDGSGCYVVRKLLLDGEGKPHRTQISLNICERTTVSSGHRQIGTGAVFGPPPGASDASDGEEEDDEAHPQGSTLVRFRRARLLGRWDRRGGVDRRHG